MRKDDGMLKKYGIVGLCCIGMVTSFAAYAASDKTKKKAHDDMELDTTMSFTSLVPQSNAPLGERLGEIKTMAQREEAFEDEDMRASIEPLAHEEQQEKDLFQWFSTYAEVIGLVQQKGFKSVDFSKFIQNSLKSAVASIDAHSAFFDQESYKATLEATSGEFSGIGISIMGKAPDDDVLSVVDVIQAGPADKVGIQAGDKIIEVNKEKLRGLSSDEVVNKLKGKVGTTVELKIMRDDKPLEFTVMRDVIKDQNSLCYYFKDQKVYYVSLSLFTENAAQQMATLLKKANDGECNGIVLDLRRNPGGTLDSAIDMASLFLPKGSLVVSTRDSKRRTVAEYVTKNEPLLKSDVPIFILVNNFTASAAEILAGCLAHHSKEGVQIVEQKGKQKIAHNLMVFIVGTPTFGKGSVQELIPIKNGCALKLTTMLYFLPNNVSIQATGIKPDFLVQPKLVPHEQMRWVDQLYGKENSLKNHITEKEVHQSYGDDGKDLEKHDDSEKTDETSQDLGPQEIAAGKGGMVQGVRSSKKALKEEKGKKKSLEEQRREGLALDVQVQACVNMISMFTLGKASQRDAVATRTRAFDFLKSHYVVDQPAVLEKIE